MARARALVVDDAQNLCRTLAMYLESAGWQVIAARQTRPAIEAVRRTPFDIAFVDLRLGDENGMELISRLHALSPATAIVLITAYDSDAVKADAVSRGACACLTKPFAPHDIDVLLSRTVAGSSPEPRP
jgi:NtrC-family two-component system response regulator AlgB